MSRLLETITTLRSGPLKKNCPFQVLTPKSAKNLFLSVNIFSFKMCFLHFRNVLSTSKQRCGLILRFATQLWCETPKTQTLTWIWASRLEKTRGPKCKKHGEAPGCRRDFLQLAAFHVNGFVSCCRHARTAWKHIWYRPSNSNFVSNCGYASLLLFGRTSEFASLTGK